MAKVGLWRIEESEPFFLEQLDLHDVEREELASVKGHKRLEWLASRLLLWHLQPEGFPQRLPVCKDEFNKPHFAPLYEAETNGSQIEPIASALKNPGSYRDSETGPEREKRASDLDSDRLLFFGGGYSAEPRTALKIEAITPALRDLGSPAGQGTASGIGLRILPSLSISHSRGMAAAITAPISVGVDVQQIVPKIGSIAHKFMREEETKGLHTRLEIEHLHVFWGAKEALYKAYGRKELDFRRHIFVEPRPLTLPFGTTEGWVKKEGYSAHFQIHYRLVENYLLVWCCEAG